MTVTDERIVEFPALKDAQGKLDEKRKNLASILREAGTNYDMNEIKSLQGDSQAKVEQIRALNTEIDECKSKVDGLLVVARAAASAADAKSDEGSGESGDGTGRERKGGKRQSFGEMLLGSDAIKGYKAGSGQGPMARLDLELKTLFQTSAGWDPAEYQRQIDATRPAGTASAQTSMQYGAPSSAFGAAGAPTSAF